MIEQLKDNECLYDPKTVLVVFLAMSLVASDREVENFDYTSHAKIAVTAKKCHDTLRH